MASSMPESLVKVTGKGSRRLADVLSYVLHPAVLMLATVIIISSRVRNDLLAVALDVVILLAGLLPGLLYIFVRTRRGEFSHYHLLLKEERRVVLPMLLLGMVGSFVLYVMTKAPPVMLQSMVTGVLAGAGAVVISRFWKISLHSAVAMGCAALLIPFSWMLAATFAILAVVVGIARLMVRHHTWGQIVVGWGYGFCVSALLLWLLSTMRF
jgi:membrane-associated phospholipid phosphatase